MIGDTLTLLALCQQHGILSAAGYDDGYCYYQRSDDAGATVKAFADDSTRKQVCPASAQQPAIVVRPDGSVVVVATQGTKLVVYVTRDGGEVWEAADVIS